MLKNNGQHPQKELKQEIEKRIKDYKKKEKIGKGKKVSKEK